MIERVNSAQFAIYLAAAAAAAGETEIEGRIIIKQKSQLAAAAETRRRRLNSSEQITDILTTEYCCVRGSWSHVERVEITN